MSQGNNHNLSAAMMIEAFETKVQKLPNASLDTLIQTETKRWSDALKRAVKSTESPDISHTYEGLISAEAARAAELMLDNPDYTLYDFVRITLRRATERIKSLTQALEVPLEERSSMVDIMEELHGIVKNALATLGLVVAACQMVAMIHKGTHGEQG